MSDFKIFAVVACGLLWFHGNKAYHDGVPFDACRISWHINKITVEHFDARKQQIHHPLWKNGFSLLNTGTK